MAVLKDLIVHGASRFLNGINTDSVKANTIEATNGYFKYLKAIDGDIENLSVEDLLAQKATVVGLLDVKGELHTNQWTNSNIANIGGVFYISPTVISTTATVVIGGSANSRTLTVSEGSFATTTVPTWSGTTESTSAWVIGSRVMVTGSITYNNVEYPLGTCTGYISGALSSTGFTVQQIYSEALEDIFSIVGTASLAGSNIQISMYEIGPGNNNNQSNNASYKPVGILMTSYGMADKSTHIDIYGGTNAKNTNSKTSGMADPNVRIGYLGGLDSYTDSSGQTRTPKGWGIYTDNGYFKGTIVADSGSIGSYKIDSQYLQSSDGTTGLSIRDDSTTLNWAFWAGGASTSAAKFRVTHDGTLYCKDIQATGGSISGDVSIGGNVTIASTVTIGGKNQSEYLNSNIEVGGRNLLLGTVSPVTWTVSLNSSNYATKDCYKTYSPVPSIFVVDDLVTISFDWSTTATGGSFHLECGAVTPYIWGTVVEAVGTRNATSNYVDISSSNTSGHCRITFKITSAVVSAANTLQWMRIRVDGADTSGKTFTISNAKAERGNKATDWTPAPEDVEVDIYEASTKATSYITYVSATEGIKIHNSGDTTDYVQVNSSAIKMYRNNVEKMLLDDASFRIGSIGSNKRNLYITDSAVQIRNNTVVLAEYGETTKFYDGNGVADSNIAAQIGADGLDIIKGHIGDWIIESGDIKYSAGVNETSPTISLTKQSTSNLRSIASIDASSSSETNPNSGARISVFYESYNSSTQTWQGDFAGCYIIPDKISLLSIQGRSLIEPNTISVGGSSPTSTIESVSTGGGAFIQANSAASEADIKAMSGGGTVYIYSSNNGNRGMYGTNSSNTGHSIIDVTNTNASYFRGQATSVSDLKKKDVIEGYDWKIDEFINGLKPIAFRRIHDDGTLGDRIHMGFGAQDVRELTKFLYNEELSLYQAKVIDETKDGKERELEYFGEDIDDKNLSWSLTYEELIAPMVFEIQRLMDRVDKLESEIKALKS